MKVKVLGITNVDYVNKQGRQVTGLTLHCLFLTPQKRVEGQAVDKIFLSSSLGLSCMPYIKPGQDAELSYNRWGSVEDFVILTPPESSPGFDPAAGLSAAGGKDASSTAGGKDASSTAGKPSAAAK